MIVPGDFMKVTEISGSSMKFTFSVNGGLFGPMVENIDDPEKTPNHGKHLVSLGTVIVTPPVLIVGIRGYSKNQNGKHAEFDMYANNLPKNISALFKSKNKESLLEHSEVA